MGCGGGALYLEFIPGGGLAGEGRVTAGGCYPLNEL